MKWPIVILWLSSLVAFGQTIKPSAIQTKALNNIQFADQFANVQAAINALPAAGGIVYATSSGVNTSLGTLDPGSRAVTLYLGPFNFTASQIKLENSFHLIGAGSNNVGTVITATSTSLSPIILGTTSPVAGVVLRGFRLNGATSNTGNGIDIIAGVNGGGLWYSKFSDIVIGATTPFAGIGFNFDGTAGGTPKGINQFNMIENVFVFRKSGGSYGCQWLGSNGQFSIINLECEGQAQGDGTNINIASSASNLYPYSLQFNNLTTEAADVGVNISGATNVTFLNPHEENLNGGFLMSLGTGSVNTYGVSIVAGEFDTTGVNSGNGYLVKTTAGATNSNLNFIANRIGTVPDSYLSGFTNNVTEEGTVNPSGVVRPNAINAGTTLLESGSISGLAGSGIDACYADSTAHALKCAYNNGTFFQIPQVIPATSAAFSTATTAGTCVQSTTAVTGATTAMAVSVSPVSTPGVGAVWSAFVSSAGNVTINECAVATSAGGSIAFNIRVTP